MDLDSPLVWEEAKWFSTPSGKQILYACRVKMHLPFERSVKPPVFFRRPPLPIPSHLY